MSNGTVEIPVDEFYKKRATLIVNLVSGGVGGFCVVLVGYPFDLLKTRLQTSTNRPTRLSAEIRSIWTLKGFRGFYQGASAPFLGVSPIFAANFFGYELGKRLYDRIFQGPEFRHRDYCFNGGLPIGQYAFSAAFSALETAIVVIPAERIKVYMQMPRLKGSPLAHKNALQVGLLLYKEGGLRALFRGGTATLARDVPGLVTFFTSYEMMKQYLRSADDRSEHSLWHIGGVMLAGGLSGIISWMVSLPSDVLKSRVQAARPGDAIHSARFPTLYVLRNMLQKEGPLALYRGIIPVLLRAFPANAACFLGYELTKVFLHPLLL